MSCPGGKGFRQIDVDDDGWPRPEGLFAAPLLRQSVQTSSMYLSGSLSIANVRLSIAQLTLRLSGISSSTVLDSRNNDPARGAAPTSITVVEIDPCPPNFARYAGCDELTELCEEHQT